MTKTERLRRVRADRRELAQLREYKRRTQYSGEHIQQLHMTELGHARLEVARNLGFTIILKHSVGNTWNVRAVQL